MVARYGCLVERELSAQCQFKMVAHVGNARCRQDGGESLAAGSPEKLVVVKLVEEIQVTKRPLEPDVLNVVAQVGQRVLDDRIGEHMMVGGPSQRRHEPEIALDAERAHVLHPRRTREVTHCLFPKEDRAEGGMAG